MKKRKADPRCTTERFTYGAAHAQAVKQGKELWGVCTVCGYWHLAAKPEAGVASQKAGQP